MKSYHTKNTIQHFMHNIGGIWAIIDRVDFTPINKQPGFGEEVDSVVKSAFIHFSHAYMNYATEFWTAIEADQPFKLHINKNEYWICLKNKKPIQTTMMNIHQVVENCRLLEKQLEEKSKKIEELEKQVDGLQDVVHQLVGGLFCPHTQRDILYKHIDVLNGRDKNARKLPNESKWIHCPTTRQGDDCEKRIMALEIKMDEFMEERGISDDNNNNNNFVMVDREPENNITLKIDTALTHMENEKEEVCTPSPDCYPKMLTPWG